MKQRISIKDLEPEAYKAMAGLEKYLSSTKLDKAIKELIKIRASQINGCAYCIEIHTAEALKNGETHKRLFALSAWWESPLFTEREKAVLAITEEVSLIAHEGLTEDTFQAAKKFFTDCRIYVLNPRPGSRAKS